MCGNASSKPLGGSVSEHSERLNQGFGAGLVLSFTTQTGLCKAAKERIVTLEIES